MARKFNATVKEPERGPGYIVIEAHEANGLPDNQVIRITFEQGTDIDTVNDLKRTLNTANGISKIEVVKW